MLRCVETFLDDTFDLTNHICDYVKYLSHAIKHSYMAEDQEVLVKKRLERLVSKIELSVEHTLAIKISKELIHSDEDVVVMFVYILPQGLCTTEIVTPTAISLSGQLPSRH